jgi:precorrin-6B methylase 1
VAFWPKHLIGFVMIELAVNRAGWGMNKTQVVAVHPLPSVTVKQ